MSQLSSLPPLQTEHGTVSVASRQQIEQVPAWRQAFANCRKDYRYYQIVEDTLPQGFDHKYFVLECPEGQVRAIQPFFLLDQDLLQGAGPAALKMVAAVRRLLPRALSIRTLMVGCAAGEGHLSFEEHAGWTAQCLHAVLSRFAKQMNASLVVLKEFPAAYREPLAAFSNNGYTRVPSLPMTRLGIDYGSFDEYMTKVLSKVTRKSIRRKLKVADAADPIELTVVQDVSPFVDEIYPLYLEVFERSKLQFERLTKEYLCRLGQEMPDKARFFIWRQNGKAIAFSLCLIHGDAIYDEYLGMNYSVALDLHLYFYTLRDILRWAMEHRYKWYCSSCAGYDPKLHLRCELDPLDLYVTHTSPVANFVLRRVLPWLEPTRNDKTLQQFPNYHAVWGRA